MKRLEPEVLSLAKSHGESQPALGGCPELLTGDFPFCCTVAVPLEEDWMGGGAAVPGNWGLSVHDRPCSSILWSLYLDQGLFA